MVKQRKPSDYLKGNEQKIIEIVEANNACNPRVFGSVARGEDTEDSDLDILISQKENIDLFNLADILSGIEVLVDCKVDVVIEQEVQSESLRSAINQDLKDLYLQPVVNHE
ncbi:nucleotidyltransferase family protein (plasmid) [Neptuniibacter sp. QD72_48]|uniref:nucleotidyltransferase family protein n=1 Tax=Neptuniibacter sp. QD72_48 TaxID=3398214 RepID=UPI0039F4B74E